MGVIIKKYVDNDCLLGVWEITEDYDTLLSTVNLDEADMALLKSFGNHKRKLEWLSVRNLVVEMVAPGTKIVYNRDRKPFLMGNSFNISISHSNNLTSILLSKNKRVGIDLEFMSHKISRLEFKFINQQEYITDDEDLKKYHLYIHWCAKEAMYKICDKQEINFRENLTVSPFEPAKEGVTTGELKNRIRHEKFKLHYFEIDNYVVVWCNK